MPDEEVVLYRIADYAESEVVGEDGEGQVCADINEGGVSTADLTETEVKDDGIQG